MRRTLIALGLVALIVTLAMAGTALAQTPTPTPNQPKKGYNDIFLDKLADALGTSRENLSNAFTKARNDTVDQAVKDGRMTQQQADKLKSQKNAGPGFSFRGLPPIKVKARIAFSVNKSQVMDAIAGALGMTTDALRSQLKAGKSLSDLAKDKEQAVKDAVLKVEKDQLDQAVKNGKLTQAQADQLYGKLEKTNPLKMFGGQAWGKMHAGQQRGQNSTVPNSKPSRGPASSGAGTL